MRDVVNRPRRSLLLTQVSAIALAMACSLAAAPALAQTTPNVIVPDGRTLTQATNLGAVTDVTTATVSGTSAFNSFSRFEVGAGGTVNLQLPAGASTLFNLVRDAPIQIDGVLNSYRSGQIGGRVFFADPFGMVVGAGGSINVGSLSVSTPTADFLDKIIAPNGTIDAARVADLAAGNVPISATGSLVVNGRINAAGNAVATGRRLFASAVNTEGLDGVASVGVASVGVAAVGVASDAVTLNSADITINTAYVTTGGDFTATALNSVTVTGTGSVDTRSNGVADTAGDITITAPTITLQSGSTLNASALDASVAAQGDGAATNIVHTGAGNITLTASQSDTETSGQTTATTAITLAGTISATQRTNAIDTGGTITVAATSSAISNYESGTTAEMIALPATLQLPGLSGMNAGWVAAAANSTITVGGSAKISGGAISLQAANTATAATAAVTLAAPLGFGIGVVVGQLQSAANVDVQTGATINAVGALTVKASNAATLDITAGAFSTTLSLLDVTVAYSSATIDAKANIDPGAVITVANAGTLKVVATNTNSFSTAATSMAAAGGKAAAAVAIADGFTSNATATNGANLGTVDARIGNLIVEADSLTLKNLTSASSSVGSNVITTGLFNFKQPALLASLTSKFSAIPNIASKLGADGSSSPKFGSAVALTLNQHHTATASLAGNNTAAPTVFASGQVAVSGRVVDSGIRNDASSSISSSAQPTPQNPSATLAISAAVAYGDYNHDSTAIIGDDVSVTAPKIGVAATNELPVDIAWVPSGSTFDGVGAAVGALSGYLSSNLGVVGNILTSFANSVTSETGLGLAGAVNYFSVDNTTNAWVGDANLTSKGSGAKSGWTVTLDNADTLSFATAVAVQAAASIDTINVAGSPANAASGPAGAALGVGLMFAYTAYDSDTDAGVSGGATVDTDADLTVEATSTDTIFTLGVGGGEGAGTSIDGSVAMVALDQATHASISNKATVTARSVAVQAKEALSGWSVGGDLSISTGGSAIGITAGVLTATTDTQAFVGDNDEDKPTGVSGSSGEPVGNITAATLAAEAVTAGSLGTAAVAATVATSSPPKPPGSPPGGWANAKSRLDNFLSRGALPVPTVGSAAPPASSFGLALSGAAAVTLPTLSTQAFLDGAIVANADTSVQARNYTLIDAGAGSAALSLATAAKQKSSAVSGVVAFQSSNNFTDASVKGGSKLTNLAGLQVLALSGGTRTAVGVAGAVNLSTSGGSASTATGSVSITEIEDSTTAEIDDATVSGAAGATALEVGAYNSVDIGAGGGSFSIGGSKGFGAALTLALLSDGSSGATAGAAITDATVSNFGSVSVSGLDATTVNAGAAMGSISGDGSSLGGAVVVLTSTRTTSALIQEGSTLTGIGSGGVTVAAADQSVAAYETQLAADTDATVNTDSYVDLSGSPIGSAGDGSAVFAVAGTVQAGSGNVGVSWVNSSLADHRTAAINNSSVATAGDVSATASSDANIVIGAIGVGVATGQALSGVGSVTDSSSTGGVVATIGSNGRSTINADDVTVSASDTSSLWSVAGDVVISTGGASAVGAAVAVAKIDEGAGASVGNTDFVLTGDLTVDASSARDIHTAALSVAVAGAASSPATLSGAITVNTIGGQTGATLSGVTSGPAAGAAAGKVTVTATDSSTIQSLAGDVAGGMSSATLGASVAVNDISNEIFAGIGGSPGQTVLASDVLIQASTAATIKTLAVGVALSAASNPATVAGAGSIVANSVATQTGAGISSVTVTADNNVGVLAEDEDTVQVIAGAAGLSTSGAGVGLSVVVNEMNSGTNASIGDGAWVDGKAIGPGLTVSTGALATDIDTTSIKSAVATMPSLTTATKTVTGVAVNAASAQAVTAISFAAGLTAGPAMGASADAVTNILSGSTQASVDGASINQLAGARLGQQLDVNASSHTYSGTFVLGAAAGDLAAAAAVAVNKFDRLTAASITDSTTTSRGATAVAATASQNVAAIAAGLGVGGGGGGAATAIVNVLSAETQAYVTGGSVTAPSLAVTAQTIVEASDIAGAVAAAAGVAVGATFDVEVSENSTLAYVGDADETTTLFLSGPLTVTADTTSNFSNLGISGALSGSVSVAGMVTYNSAINTTRAGVYNVTGALGSGDVAVKGSDKTTLDQTLGGGAVGGDAGVGAALIVDVLQSSVTGEIVDGSLTTTGGVAVAATSEKDITALSATGAIGGALGVDAGVGVILIGSGDTGGAAAQLNAAGVPAQINSLASSNNTTAFNDDTLVDRANVNQQSSARAVGVGAGLAGLTVASISGATISAASVSVAATNTTSVANTTGAGALGAVGVGMGVGYVRVYGAVTAQIDDGANITAGDVSVVALAQDGADGVESDGYVGAAGAVGLGAVVADAVVENTVTASLGGTITAPAGAARSGATVLVGAGDSSTVTTNTYNGEIGGLAAGASVSHAARTSTVLATTDRAALTGYGSLGVTAGAAGAVTALATAVAGGAVEAGAGADAQATDSATVTASFDAASTIASGGNLNLTAAATPQASAHALGAAVGGGLALGVSIATANAAPTVTALVADNANLTGAGAVTLAATTAVPTGAESANALAEAGTGGLLVGVDATSSTAAYDGVVNATVGNNVTLPDAAVSIAATNNSNQKAATLGVVAGLLAAGGNASSATANATTSATLGAGTITTATRNGDLTISATGQDTLRADTTSGSGGLAGGAAALASTTDTSTTTAAILDDTGAHMIHGRDIVITAAHTADVLGVADSTLAAAFGYSGASVTNTVTAATTARVGAGVDLAGRTVKINASTTTLMDSDDPSVTGGAGGAINGAAAASTTSITDTTLADVGAGATLTTVGDATVDGLISVLADNTILASDAVTLTTGGAVELPDATSTIDANFTNGVTVAENAGLTSSGEIQIGTYSQGRVSSYVAVKTYGLAGEVEGATSATLDGDQSIDIGANAHLLAGGDLTVTAGQSGDAAWTNDLSARAHTEAYNDTLIPASTSSEAAAVLDNDNTLTVATGATLNSVRDVVLGAVLGVRATNAEANGHTAYDSFSTVSGSGSAGTSETAALVMNGQATAGTDYLKSVTIDAAGNIVTASSGQPVGAIKVQPFNPYAAISALIAAVPADDTTGRVEALTRLLPFMPNAAGVAVTIPDLMVSGGSITIDAQTVTSDVGSNAALTAHGGAKITIDNASTNHLILGALTIPVEPNAGKVIFTKATLGPPIPNLTIAPPTAGDAPTIEINNTYAGTALPQIFLQAPVANLSGDVNISNGTGSVSVLSDLTAAAVSINAPSGDVTIVSSGMYAVGSPAPITYAGVGIPPSSAEDAVMLAANAQWYATYLATPAGGFGVDYDLTHKDFTGYLISGAGTEVIPGVDGQSLLYFELGNDGVGRGYTFFSPYFDNSINSVPVVTGSIARLDPVTPTTPASGIHAQAVSITAKIIDVNAPIVAGTVGNASVVIPANFGPGVATTTVNPGDTLIGATYQNGSVIIDNTTVKGAGSIYLNGQIVSSNPTGSLTVASGQTIAIENNSNLPVVVQDLNSIGGAVGEITIVDQLRQTDGVAQTVWYRYTPDGGLAQYVNWNGATDWSTAQQLVSGGGPTTSYSPVAGTRLFWDQTALLGRSANLPANGENWQTATVGNWTFQTGATPFDLFPGYNMSAVQAGPGNTSDAFTATATGGQIVDISNIAVQGGWGGPGPWAMMVPTAVELTISNSARADYPFAINFVGTPGSIDLDSIGSVNLTGQISNAAGHTNLATNGAITQISTASINSGYVSLGGRTGIGTAAQSIVAEVAGGTFQAAAVSGDINILSRNGGLTVVSATSQLGDVNISAGGALVNGAGAGAVAVSGRNVSLTAGLGGVGAANAPMSVQLVAGAGGALNADAQDGVYLTQPTGDLVIDQVRSATGDVTITALTGDVLSGTAATTVDPQVEADLARLVDGLNLSNDTGQGAVTSYGNSVVHAYNQYWAIRGQFTDPGLASFDITGHEAMFARRVELLTGQFPASNALIVSTMQTLYDGFVDQLAQAPGGVNLSSYNPQFAYQLPTGDPLYAQLTRGAAWTPAQLELAVDSSALLPVADTQYLTQAPNIIGANVTITTPAGAVGSNVAPTTFTVAANATSLTADQAAAVAAADPGDTTITTNADGSLTVQVRQERFVSVSATRTVTAIAAGDIYVATPGNLFPVNLLSGNGDIRVQAGGVATGAITAINGDVDLEASQLQFSLSIGGGGVLRSVRSNGPTNLTAQAGSLVLGDIFSAGPLAISATGSLTSAYSDGLVRIEATGISFTSGGTQSAGSVGTADSPLQVQLNGGVLSVATNINDVSSDVYINAPNGGAVTLGAVTGHDVQLTNLLGSFTVTRPIQATNDLTMSAGSLFMDPAAPPAVPPGVIPIVIPVAAIGTTVTLTASSGDIGTLSQPFHLAPPSSGLFNRINSTVTGSTLTSASAPLGAIYIDQLVKGDLTVVQVGAQDPFSLVVYGGDLSIQSFSSNWTSFTAMASGTVNLPGCAGCPTAPWPPVGPNPTTGGSDGK